jgi:regulator of sigma E protease
MAIDLLLALSTSDLFWWVDVIVKVAIALGTVVFVHELGHFLMAKACGVKVEKFMLGFDIGGYKIARRFGETVYGIGILPLGGYVKMFGQDDDPSHIKEQMEKSQVAANSADAVEKTGPNGEKYYIDRRSYLAKSVPQRMAIISAGVIMNVIFAFIFATIAYGMGVKYLPCIVSETIPGSPAWQAGFQPGDEIVQLGDREDPTFLQLRGGVTLGDLDTGIPCLVKRASTGEIVPMELMPTQEEGELATVGISSPQSLTLLDGYPVVKDSAADKARVVSATEEPAAAATENADKKAGDKSDKKSVDPAKFRGGDVVISVNDVPVNSYEQYVAELAKSADMPLVIGVLRPAKQSSDGEVTDEGKEPKSQTLSVDVPTQPFRDLGLVMTMGPITAVQEESIAEKAGIRPGDLVVQVDGKPMAETAAGLEGWTPMTLPEYLQKAAKEDREVEIKVQRGARAKSEGEELAFRVKPVVPTTIHSQIPVGAPVAADAIGIAYRVKNTVQSVAPASPAATSGIATGDRVDSAKIRFPKDSKSPVEEPEDVQLGVDHYNWPAFIDALQFAPNGTQVELKLTRSGEKEPIVVKLAPQAVEAVYIAPRGLVFEPIFRTRTAKSVSEAMYLGYEETTDSLLMVFRFLKKLGSQVPLTMLGGPGTIAVAAGDAASQGLSTLLIFLTMLSANLAVINFLPIPLLDGGHMVFLLYEGVRGRPANEKVVLGLHMAGFAFIISLMVFVIGLDVQRWIL